MTAIVGAFPSTLQNGTSEDATQVMALFAFIQAQVNNNACPKTTGSAILKGDGSGSTSAAVAGTDYCPITSGSSILKGNGAGGTTAALGSTDYVVPNTLSGVVGVSGYQKFPSGLIIQWGTATSSAAGAASVTFPTAMLNQITSVVITPAASAFATATEESGTVNGFTFSVWNAAGARLTNGVNWVAYGY